MLGCLLLGALLAAADRVGPWWSLAFLAPFAASPVVVANASAGNADAILAGLLAITLLATFRALPTTTAAFSRSPPCSPPPRC